QGYRNWQSAQEEMQVQVVKENQEEDTTIERCHPKASNRKELEVVAVNIVEIEEAIIQREIQDMNIQFELGNIASRLVGKKSGAYKRNSNTEKSNKKKISKTEEEENLQEVAKEKVTRWIKGGIKEKGKSSIATDCTWASRVA
ncbi:14102_t:CDS:2, partial [Gigaspora rosea]